jgi:hypothetical protein
MRMPWKLVAGVLLTVPAVVFTAGNLTRSDVDVPAKRTPIVIEDAAASTAARPEQAGPGGVQRSSPHRSTPATERQEADDEGDDRVEVVKPRPDDVERADDDAGRDDDPDDLTDDDTRDDTGDDAGENDRGD